MTTKTILFIDDDPFSKEMAQRACGRLDCEFLFFQSICEVFDNIDLIDPKLVVLDLGMAGLDGVYDMQAGIEVSFALRVKYGNQFPILILTGAENSTTICECLRSGADDYYSKHHDTTGLVKRIAAWLVVDYSAGNPQLERETAADLLEALGLTRGCITEKEWRQIARAEFCRNHDALRIGMPDQRSLGDLFAWQPDALRR